IIVAHSKSTKEAWSLISDIFKDNKISLTNTFKVELRSIKLGDQSMESYFQKNDSIVNILTSLDAHVNEEDVVHYALEGLSDTYNQVYGYMHWKDTFPDLKVVSLGSRVLILLRGLIVLVIRVDMFMMPMLVWVMLIVGLIKAVRLVRIRLTQLGHLGMNVAMLNNGTNVTLPTHATVTSTVTGLNIAINVPTAPHYFYASTETLSDLTTGAWNIDTGASSHLNNYVTSLSTILNSCMYSTVSVGDGHSIPITNTGHSILSTPLKSLRLNNVLITPYIVKNLIFVRQFVHDNDCTIEFNSFGFFIKDFMTRRVLV
nr:ribonuclease H-like domain-containing protein [Tanacetum cinerariifolium]